MKRMKKRDILTRGLKQYKLCDSKIAKCSYYLQKLFWLDFKSHSFAVRENKEITLQYFISVSVFSSSTFKAEFENNKSNFLEHQILPVKE